MKFIPIAAAAMLLTTAAFAQDAQAPAPSAGASDAAPVGGAAGAGDAGAASTPAGPESGAGAPAPADQSPGGQVPGGQGVGGAAGPNSTASVAPNSYPTCSRTVKDGCVQAAGRSRPRHR